MNQAKKHNSLMVAPPGVQISPVGLQIKAKLSYSQWSELVGGLQRAHRSILWLLGDALCWGEDTFGEEFSQAISEYSRGAQYNATWVSRQIEISRRRENLSWSHHAEVAMLDRDEQDRFLQEAIDHGWGVHELRGAVRLFRNPPPKLDWHETGDVPPGPQPEFQEVSELRHSYYTETAEQVRADFTPAPPVDVRAEFRHLFGLVRALRIAERGHDDQTAVRLRTSLDIFISQHERQEQAAR